MAILRWLLSRRFARARGQALMEYELVLALVAVIVIVVLVILGQYVQATYQFIIDSLPF